MRDLNIIDCLEEQGLLGRVMKDLLGCDHEPLPGQTVRCPNAEVHHNSDRKPSFVVHGSLAGGKCMAGCGLEGKLLDLVCKLHSLPDEAAAARWLEERYLNGRHGLAPRRRRRDSHEATTDAAQTSSGERERHSQIAIRVRTNVARAVSRGADMETTYEIRDADGALVATHGRVDPETGDKRMYWKGGLGGRPVKDLPLYGTELLARCREAPVVVCEGEKAADALRALKFLALATVTGAASTPSKAALEPLAERTVYLWPDADRPGREHMDRVASALGELYADVYIVAWTEAPDKGDAADLVGAGGSRDDVEHLLRSAASWTPLARPAADTDSEPAEEEAGGRARNNQATVLVKLAERSGMEFFHDGAGTPYSSLGRETWAVEKSAFRSCLTGLYFDEHGTVTSDQALRDATRQIAAIATRRGAEREVHVRCAHHDGAVYLDLADQERRVVKIDADGWRLVEDPPVRFERPPAMRSLPVPERGGSMAELRRFLNIRDDESWLMVQACVVSTLSKGPYPVLTLSGEAGSGKSTAALVLRGLLDPNEAPLRTTPKDERDLFLAARNGWVPTFDNVSRLPAWLSDALCRVSTGGGFSTRTLFSNDEETIFRVRRPVVVTGIGDVTARDDLADRAVTVGLEPIEGGRRDEEGLLRDLEAARPRLLGAILDAVSTALRRLPGVRLEDPPRLADFARWVVAAEPALDCGESTFLPTYERQRASSAETAIEASSVAMEVRRLVEEKGGFQGTASELLESLSDKAGEAVSSRRGWPKTPSHLSSELNKAASSLRNVGIRVHRYQEGSSGSRKLIRLSVLPGEENVDAADAADAFPPAERISAADAADASPTLADAADASGGSASECAGRASAAASATASAASGEKGLNHAGWRRGVGGVGESAVPQAGTRSDPLEATQGRVKTESLHGAAAPSADPAAEREPDLKDGARREDEEDLAFPFGANAPPERSMPDSDPFVQECTLMRSSRTTGGPGARQ